MVHVKICGITTPEDLRAALAAGADAIGLNFVPGTPRALANERARELSELARGQALRVGVFQDATVEQLLEQIAKVELDLVQLHGSETPADVAKMPVPVIKVLKGNGQVQERAAQYPDVDLLIDHPSGGGSGRHWDFTLARQLSEEGRRVWVAGGLTPATCRAAIEASGAYGVDACSGLELAPGRKDPARMREFVAAARSAIPPDAR